MRRVAPLLLLLLAGAFATGCGSYGDGANAKAEAALASSITAVLDADAPFVELRSVDCSGSDPSLDCLASLGVGNTVVQVHYAVAVGADGCWTADAGRTIVLGAGSETNPLPDLPAASNLKGCGA